MQAQTATKTAESASQLPPETPEFLIQGIMQESRFAQTFHGPIMKTPASRPRVTLDKLIAEWHAGDRRRRRSIEANWTRSSKAYLQAMLDFAPDGIFTMRQAEELHRLFGSEVASYWHQPFGGVSPHPWPKQDTLKRLEKSLEYQFEINLEEGFFLYRAGATWDTDASFRRFWFIKWTGYVYQRAWNMRHQAGQGGDRPAEVVYDPWTPNKHWTAEDWVWRNDKDQELRSSIRTNIADMARAGVPYKPRPLPTIEKMLDQDEPLPATAAGDPPLTLPTGSNGRPMRREIYMDKDGELYSKLAEISEEAHKQELEAMEFTVFDSPYATLGISPRESWRPRLEALGLHHMIELYSDEVIEYYVDEEYGRQAAAREMARAAAEDAVAPNESDAT